MGYYGVAYVCAQQLPKSNIRFRIIYSRGGLYFQVSLQDMQELLANYNIYNPNHVKALGTVIKLLATETRYFNHRGQAEEWLKANYGLGDMDWRLRRIGQIKPVLMREVQELDAAVYEYPTVEQGSITLIKFEKEFSAKLIAFSDMPYITMPVELAVHKFPYDELDWD